MLLHGIEMTFIIFIGSWSLAMSLALILLCIRFSPSASEIGWSQPMFPIIATCRRWCS